MTVKRIKKIGKIGGGQDGAIWGSELFRFDTEGHGAVYDLTALERGEELPPISTFDLDQRGRIAPHSNAVCFGVEYYVPEDEYPLLYTNIYNNYAGSEDPLLGVCCVYRLWREAGEYRTKLLQLIEVGFTDDPLHWRAYPDRDGVRPFGNFVIDREQKKYVAFVMRTEELGCAYFTFDVPAAEEGEWDPAFGVRRRVLTLSEVRESFTAPYHRYIQGAAAREGRIWSTEGFDRDEVNRPAIRVIDTVRGKEESYTDLLGRGISEEPEFIDFYGEKCLYSDAHGNLYAVELDG